MFVVARPYVTAVSARRDKIDFPDLDRDRLRLDRSVCEDGAQSNTELLA
jgi:hypothetical protein